MRLEVSPAAEADVDRYAARIAADSPRAGERFLARARGTFESLAVRPGKGRPRRCRAPALAGMRSWRVSGFPRHLIFYLVDTERVLIVRVVHGAMDIPRIFGPVKRAPRRGRG